MSLLSSGLSWMGANERGDIPEIQDWTNSEELKKALSGNILNNLGNPRQYSTNPAFKTTQTEVGKATQDAILGKLRDMPKTEADIMGTYNKYSAAHKANSEAQYAEDMKKQNDRYNRLGLVSSTPGLQADTNLRHKQSLQLNEDDAAMMQKAVDQEMTARQLNESIAQGWTGQGGAWDANQRGYEQNAMELSMQDLNRLLASDQMYGGEALSYLGQGAATPGQKYQSDVNSWSQPNGWDWASGMAGEGEQAALAMIGGANPLTALLGGTSGGGGTGSTTFGTKRLPYKYDSQGNLTWT